MIRQKSYGTIGHPKAVQEKILKQGKRENKTELYMSSSVFLALES